MGFVRTPITPLLPSAMPEDGQAGGNSGLRMQNPRPCESALAATSAPRKTRLRRRLGVLMYYLRLTSRVPNLTRILGSGSGQPDIRRAENAHASGAAKD